MLKSVLHKTIAYRKNIDQWAYMNFSAWWESSTVSMRCTFFLNFGQWHVGWATQPVKRSVYSERIWRVYRSNLGCLCSKDSIGMMLYIFFCEPGLTSWSKIRPCNSEKVYFLGTLNFGNSIRSYTPGGNDFRGVAVLRMVNDGGMRVCRKFKRCLLMNTYLLYTTNIFHSLQIPVP